MKNSIGNWIMENARPLEKARFSFLFEQGDKQTYYNELRKFQNNDGGFGHGLEADCTNPNSTPIQCWFAFEPIAEMNLDSNDKMVKRLCEYLASTIRDDGYWPSTIPSNNDFPRAPWWSYREEESVWGYNPTAAILGFLYRHHEKSLWKARIEIAINDFIQMNRAEMHELKCFLDLYDFIEESKDDFNLFCTFEEKLKESIESIVEKDKTKWLTSYVPRPIQLCQRNGDLASKVIEDLVIEELILLREDYQNNGIWPITWQWGQFEEEFEKAKKAWQGIFAMLILRMWKEFHLL